MRFGLIVFILKLVMPPKIVKLKSEVSDNRKSAESLLPVNTTDDVTCYKYRKLVVDDDKALECSCCNDWYHISCAKISEEAYTYLNNNPNLPGIKWCVKNVKYVHYANNTAIKHKH